MARDYEDFLARGGAVTILPRVEAGQGRLTRKSPHAIDVSRRLEKKAKARKILTLRFK